MAEGAHPPVRRIVAAVAVVRMRDTFSDSGTYQVASRFPLGPGVRSQEPPLAPMVVTLLLGPWERQEVAAAVVLPTLAARLPAAAGAAAVQVVLAAADPAAAPAGWVTPRLVCGGAVEVRAVPPLQTQTGAGLPFSAAEAVLAPTQPPAQAVHPSSEGPVATAGSLAMPPAAAVVQMPQGHEAR